VNRDEFDRLYVDYKAQSVPQCMVDIGKQLRIDWDTYDQLCNSADSSVLITKADALSDVHQLFVLLRYAYSGYEFYSTLTDFEELEAKLAEHIRSMEDSQISAIEFCKLIHQTLMPYINDGHVSIACANYEGDFLKPYMPYVTDIILEKRAEGYIVVQGAKELREGDALRREDIKGELLRTLFPGNCNECYLIGEYTHEPVEYIEIAGKPYKTHILKCCNSGNADESRYLLAEKSNYGVFINPLYQLYEDSDIHQQAFFDAGMRCASKDFVVWDLSHNHGGDSKFPGAFLRGLNNYVCDEMDTAVLRSPIVGNSDAEKHYSYKKAQRTDSLQGTYGGTLYIVMNKKTGSSAELAVSFAKSCKNVIKVGSPSAGIGLFGEVRPYRLSKSGILVCLPYKLFFEENFEIGRGYVPDYWIDDEYPVEYLEKCRAPFI